MIRDIIQLPDPRLRAVSYDIPASAFVDDGSELSKQAREGLDFAIRDLTDTMRKHHAFGLSAIQIGLPLRVVVISPRSGCAWGCMVNPVIVRRGGTMQSDNEGCMSIGGGRIRFAVKRAHKIEVAFLDRNGTARSIGLSGLSARVVQHEIDHLDGILIDEAASPDFKRRERPVSDAAAHPADASGCQLLKEAVSDRAHEATTDNAAI